MSASIAQKASKPTVAIVLCTYNGAQHIDEQLDSLLSQQWPSCILANDDSSTDNTVERLHLKCRKQQDKVIEREINVGYVRNFERGIAHALEQGFDYIALSDQDDIWHPDRIKNGMQTILDVEQTEGESVPLLVHSDLTMIDSSGQIVHDSYFRYRQYSIGNAKNLAVILGQNGVMGNTILMNRALARLALPFPEKVHVHDYWLALLAELYGERRLLAKPGVSYRIHSSNASNSTDSMKFGPLRHFTKITWHRLFQRDFRLPYKEDSRVRTLEALQDIRNTRPALDDKQSVHVDALLAYLNFSKPRHILLRDMFRYNFLRQGWRHRMRFTLALMTTRRYSQKKND
ncbi:MAG: glycosyltransferase family 2 protein [Granulosicoccus sp.]